MDATMILPQQVDGLMGQGLMDPFQDQLCGASALQSTQTIPCPKSMVGRVIGKGGETIKALQQFTGAMIQIDQSQDPTRVTVAGDNYSVKMASSMCRDIMSGNFKGFAMLRQMTLAQPDKMMPGWDTQHKPQPVYVEGYGFVPPSQYIDMEDPKAALAKTLNQTTLTQDGALAAMDGISPVMTQGGPNGYAALASNAALENSLAYNNALANGVNSNALGSLPLFGQGKACSTSAAQGMAARRMFAAGGWPGHEQATAGTSPSSTSTFNGQALGSPHSSLAQSIAYGNSLPNIPRSAIATFGTQLGNNLSAQEMNGLLNGSATQSQLDMFASRAAHSSGIPTIPESQALLQDLNAAAAAARLGLDSSLDMHQHSNGHYGGQQLDCGPRSVSMGALGSSAALRAAANTSLGLSHGLPTGLPNGMPTSQPQPSASQPGSARPTSAAPTSADAPVQSQPIAKESPASSISSTGSLFSHNAPALPPGWLQLRDPEGRVFYMHAATQQTTWTFPPSS